MGAAGTAISGRSPASPVRMGALTGVPRSPHPWVPAPPRPRLSPGCRGAEAQVTRAVPARGAGTQTGDGPCRSLAVGGAVPPPPRLCCHSGPAPARPRGARDEAAARPPPHHRTRAPPARWRRHRLGRAAGLGRDPRTRLPSAGTRLGRPPRRASLGARPRSQADTSVACAPGWRPRDPLLPGWPPRPGQRRPRCRLRGGGGGGPRLCCDVTLP